MLQSYDVFVKDETVIDQMRWIEIRFTYIVVVLMCYRRKISKTDENVDINFQSSQPSVCLFVCLLDFCLTVHHQLGKVI